MELDSEPEDKRLLRDPNNCTDRHSIIIIIVINEIYRAQNSQGQQMRHVSCCMMTVILEQEHFQSFPEHWQ